ncbi:MAG: hypothetical protein OEV87_05240 [Phycisphaerae bacterium]|nr:hypothetical protein [Phycisphaerae bacterium]
MRQYEYNVPEYCYFSVCRNIIERRYFVSKRGAPNVFPLYIYQEDQTQKGIQRTFGDAGIDWRPGKGGRVPNLDKGFVDGVSKKIKLQFVSDGKGDLKKTFGPEDVFAWIYGVFHSPQYRERYAEFLKIDFPRVPLPKDKKQFAQVCAVGHELVGLHLIEADILEAPELQPRFDIEGDMEVAAGYPKYDNGKVFVNEKQYFDGVREDVWQFMIGGYQVCEKWLKDRRGRKLSYSDVQHYQKICVALGETIRLMADERIAIFECPSAWQATLKIKKINSEAGCPGSRPA